MESFERHNIKDENRVEDDFYYDDEMEDEMDDEKFCSSVLKQQSNKILDGISLKDLCEGKEVMFQINDKYLNNDDEQFHEEEDTEQYYDEEKSEIVNSFYKDDIEKHKGKQTDFYLNESFKSLVSRMTSITDDDCIKKEEIISGINKVVPENSYVIVHYNLFKETSEEPFDSTYLRKRPERVILGQGNLIPGLEIAIKTMKKRERSRFFIKWNYAFGALGCPNRIGPKCDIIADITLLNFKESDLSESVNDCSPSFERFVSQINIELTAASDDIKEENVDEAIKKYKRAVRLLNNLAIANNTEDRICQELRAKSIVNLAICYNKLGKYQLACSMCHNVLTFSPQNKKALFHYARASTALSNFTMARSLLVKLLKISPNNPYVIEELRKLELKKGSYERATKEFWKKAFNLDAKKRDCEDYQGADSPCKDSKDDTNGDSEDVFKDSKKNQGHGVERPLVQEKEICKKFESHMDLNSENFMDLE